MTSGTPLGDRWVAAEHIIDSVVVTGDGNVVIYYADGGQVEPPLPRPKPRPNVCCSDRSWPLRRPARGPG